jgi:hypothetical protein
MADNFFGGGGIWSLNSGVCACQTSTVPLKPHLQSILLWLFIYLLLVVLGFEPLHWLFWRWRAHELLARLASNGNPSSQSQPPM